ncbi:MAG: hypothetical protein WC648_02060 [Candidatus Paceibacterota bacterium]|jgi:hypothetical protein
MSILSAIYQLCPHLANQRPYVGAGNTQLVLTVGDASMDEMVSVLKNRCTTMGGYKDDVDFVQPFFKQLQQSPCTGSVNLIRVCADLGPANSWPNYCGHEINRMAREKGLEFCTSEIVCKLFQAWLHTPKARDHFYVSCGDLFCFFTDYGGDRRQIIICNDYSDIPFGEDVIYLDSRK